MENKVQDSRVRKDLKCLSLGESAYTILQTLAQEAGLNASAYNRLLIQKAYKRSRSKLAAEASTQ